MADTVTLTALRAQVRAQGGVRLTSDAALDAMINHAIGRLHRKVCRINADFLLANTPQSVTVVAGTADYSLPTDFYVAVGVDAKIDASTWAPLERFSWGERHRLSSVSRLAESFYRIVGAKLRLMPTPAGAGTVQLWYVPKATRLVNASDTWDTVSGWDEYVVLYVLTKFASGDESDMAQYLTLLKEVERDIVSEVVYRDSGEPDMIRDRRRERGDPALYDQLDVDWMV